MREDLVQRTGEGQWELTNKTEATLAVCGAEEKPASDTVALDFILFFLIFFFFFFYSPKTYLKKLSGSICPPPNETHQTRAPIKGQPRAGTKRRIIAIGRYARSLCESNRWCGRKAGCVILTSKRPDRRGEKGSSSTRHYATRLGHDTECVQDSYQHKRRDT